MPPMTIIKTQYPKSPNKGQRGTPAYKMSSDIVSAKTMCTSTQLKVEEQQAEDNNKFTAYMTTKKDQKVAFNITFRNGHLCVHTIVKNLEKKRIPLVTLHVKLDPSLIRQPSDEEETKESQKFKWYPMKLQMSRTKSRVLYFPTRESRQTAIDIVLRQQGFDSQLDQYHLISEIEEGCSNPVHIARHKLSDMKVAIKAIPAKKYLRLQQENMIDEGAAMDLCRDSENVIGLVEKFKMDGNVYIVTKYAAGGDLLSYCMKQAERTDSDGLWFTEDTIKHIFGQIAHGLYEMHQVGLVHRDLKLLNIFLSDNAERPRVKIGDLGLAAYLKP